jgi:hypothetical protein
MSHTVLWGLINKEICGVSAQGAVFVRIPGEGGGGPVHMHDLVACQKLWLGPALPRG